MTAPMPYIPESSMYHCRCSSQWGHSHLFCQLSGHSSLSAPPPAASLWSGTSMLVSCGCLHRSCLWSWAQPLWLSVHKPTLLLDLVPAGYRCLRPHSFALLRTKPALKGWSEVSVVGSLLKQQDPEAEEAVLGSRDPVKALPGRVKVLVIQPRQIPRTHIQQDLQGSTSVFLLLWFVFNFFLHVLLFCSHVCAP